MTPSEKLLLTLSLCLLLTLYIVCLRLIWTLEIVSEDGKINNYLICSLFNRVYTGLQTGQNGKAGD